MYQALLEGKVSLQIVISAGANYVIDRSIPHQRYFNRPFEFPVFAPCIFSSDSHYES